MLKRKLLVIGFTAAIAGILHLGSASSAIAGPIAAQGASSAKNSIVSSTSANVVKVGSKRHVRRDHSRVHRRYGHRRYYHHRRHYRHYPRYGKRYYHGRYYRRPRVSIGIGIPFGYGYGYPYYRYRAPAYYPPAVVYRPRARRTVYAGSCRSLGVGTRAWANCCSAKYRSFNRRTGLYLAYSGRYRACR